MPKGLNEWERSEKIKVISNYAVVYSRPEKDSRPVTDMTLNGTLKVLEAEGAWLKVATPDLREGYIESGFVSGLGDRGLAGEALRQSIVERAMSMMGVPYLWGGNSSKMSDCSGFVHTVFGAQGIMLPRDAGQQIAEGVEVRYSADFSELKAADLLFFGRPRENYSRGDKSGRGAIYSPER